MRARHPERSKGPRAARDDGSRVGLATTLDGTVEEVIARRSVMPKFTPVPRSFAPLRMTVLAFIAASRHGSKFATAQIPLIHDLSTILQKLSAEIEDVPPITQVQVAG